MTENWGDYLLDWISDDVGGVCERHGPDWECTCGQCGGEGKVMHPGDVINGEYNCPDCTPEINNVEIKWPDDRTDCIEAAVNVDEGDTVAAGCTPDPGDVVRASDDGYTFWFDGLSFRMGFAGYSKEAVAERVNAIRTALREARQHDNASCQEEVRKQRADARRDALDEAIAYLRARRDEYHRAESGWVCLDRHAEGLEQLKEQGDG